MGEIVTENIDRLFLELSQFTRAKTKRDLEQEREIVRLLAEVERLRESIGKIGASASSGLCTTRPSQIEAAFSRIKSHADLALADSDPQEAGDEL